ncbi:MAG TPA: FlgD immunoglobulin-like domain containing protein [Candidatus Eisenbacteria bacterium]
MQAAVTAAGGGTTALTPGDTLTLEFAATPVPEGQVREWFLVTRGFYTSELGATPGADGPSGSSGFALAQNHPNPFAATTSIAFRLPIECRVSLEVFDLNGRRVKSLVEEAMPAGEHAVEWNRRDAGGSPVKPGVYLYRLAAGSFREQRKMVLLSR